VLGNNVTQEILMDITDVEGDERARIRTLPVLFGPKIALTIALSFLAGAAVSPLVLSVLPNVSVMCIYMYVYTLYTCMYIHSEHMNIYLL